MNVIFTCGGTAGHISPALAVASLLKERHPEANILFVGAEDGMETDLVPRAGFRLETVKISNFQRKLSPKGIVHNVKSLGYMIGSRRSADRIIREFQPDVIVVNLGTNDSVGTKNMEMVERAAEGFLKKIRDCNPKSYILWCYGMLGDEICSVLENAVQNYKVKTGDARVEFVKLPDTLAGEFGSRQHPGHISHEKAAKVLTEKIQGLTNAVAGGNITSV